MQCLGNMSDGESGYISPISIGEDYKGFMWLHFDTQVSEDKTNDYLIPITVHRHCIGVSWKDFVPYLHDFHYAENPEDCYSVEFE